jgi:predicted MFS family arabinose efflux permease
MTIKNHIVALASILSMRMLGLFMIFPIFTLYAQQLPNVTPILIGLAIGIYGFTQAILQIPFGMLSDRVGRKPIIYLGLIIFAIGSVIAALSSSIVGIIIGRALQGSGAIASTILALTADLSHEADRTKAMATLGVSIGISFIVALILGPIFYNWIGMSGIFWFTAALAILGCIILYYFVPQPTKSYSTIETKFITVLTNTQLLRLDIGILLLHFSLTALFVVLPLSLAKQVDAVWQVYIPVLSLSIVAMVPSIILAEKYNHMKFVFLTAISVLALSQLGLSYLHTNFIGIIIMLFLFFTAFNILEATLPSLISKLTSIDSKGTAMGVYSSAQFIGAFLGGISGGFLHQYYGIEAVFIICALLIFIWLILALPMKNFTKS